MRSCRNGQVDLDGFNGVGEGTKCAEKTMKTKNGGEWEGEEEEEGGKIRCRIVQFLLGIKMDSL
jgi:hypothetical protein